MSEASRRSACGVFASCVVHAVITLAAPRQEPAREPIPAEPLWMELQLEQPEPVASPPLPVPSFVGKTPHERSPARERSASTRAESVQPVRAAPVDTASTPSAAEPTRSERRALPLDLSPLAAARALTETTYVPERDAGVTRGEDVPLSPMAVANALARQVPGIRASKGSGRSVEGAVVDGVEDTLYNVLRPWKLLQRTMRGSEYRYTGGGFDAAILPDGSVRFRDKDGTNLTVSSTQTRETGPGNALPPAPAVGLSVGDPRALWQRLRGKDPFAAERRLFLERTRALREYLAGRAIERGMSADEERSQEAEPVPQLEPPE